MNNDGNVTAAVLLEVDPGSIQPVGRKGHDCSCLSIPQSRVKLPIPPGASPATGFEYVDARHRDRARELLERVACNVEAGPAAKLRSRRMIRRRRSLC
jgi:hypothetical protein